MSRFISRSMVIDRSSAGREANWSVMRDLVGSVLREAQRGEQPGEPLKSGDLRIRYQYNAAYLRDEVLVTWDEVS